MAVVIVGCADSENNSAGTNTGTGTGNNPFVNGCEDTKGDVPGSYGAVLSACLKDILTTTPKSLLDKTGIYNISSNTSGDKDFYIVFEITETDQMVLKQSLVDYFGELTDMKTTYPDEPDFKIFKEVWQGSKGNTTVAYRVYYNNERDKTYNFLTYHVEK